MKRLHRLLGSPLAALLFAPAAGLAADEAEVRFERRDDKIEVHLDDRLITVFHFGDEWDKPFLHPLRTASGVTVSRGYPLEDVPGEHTDHVWHRGLWYGHGDVSGEDFWREIPDRKTSKLVAEEPPETSTEDGSGTLRAELAMRTPAGKTIGTIVEEYTFSKVDGAVVIDAAVTLRANHGQPLEMGDTDDGGLGLRLAEPFRQETGALLQNSEGLRDTENIWGKPAKWVDYSARVEGQPVHVAVFDHPSNLRHPTRWHARGYSLFSANPFALRSFTGDDSKDGGYTIPAGGSETFRYRIVIAEGEAAPEQIEERYAAFAKSS